MSYRGWILVLILLASPAVAAPPSLNLQIGKTTISVSGLTPGGTAVIFGASREPIPDAYMDRVERWAASVDDVRHDGTATFDLGKDVPAVSVWAAVEVQTGQYATSAGQSGLRVLPLLSNPLRKGNSGLVDRFAFARSYLLLLYVHPGKGAWTWYATDGTAGDLDGRNGSAVVSLAAGEAVGAPSSPSSAFVPGGILVAIDYINLDLAVVRVDEALIRGAR
jgi:hypothetical protein